MIKVQNPNLEILELAVGRLGPVAEQMVFLGGCATGLLITDVAAPTIRPTVDVDTIVQVTSLAEYHQLSGSLRERGFREDTRGDAPVCRWVADRVVLDVMPADMRILGFGNRWYVSAVQHSEMVTLPSGSSIRLVSAPYFLVTKLEAFNGRGRGDYVLSHDIEDVVAVLDGRPEVVNEVRGADANLIQTLSQRFGRLLEERRFLESLPGHMPTDAASQARVELVLERINEIASM